MRLVSTAKCQEGMEIAKPIYNEKGQVLVGAGVLLTEKLLSSLKRRNIAFLYIKDKATEDIIIEDEIPFELRVEADQVIEETFKELAEGVGTRGKALKTYKFNDLERVFKSLLNEMRHAKNATNLLTHVYAHDNYTYSHCTNVTIYTLAMGVKLDFNERQLNDIGMGAMLHDLGKIFVPKEIINKPGKLTPEEFDTMKKHSELGWEILRNEHSIALSSAHCAFQHHERFDGSGYPRGLAGEEILPYARLMAVADVFDALTSSRSYRKAMLPHEAMEIIFAETHSHFDPFYVDVFQKSVAIYPEGITVTLNTGETAVVVKYQFESPGRPLVRIIRDEHGQELAQPFDLDLSKNLSRMIVDCDAVM